MLRNHPLIFMNYTDTYLILSTIINFLANFEIPQTLPFFNEHVLYYEWQMDRGAN